MIRILVFIIVVTMLQSCQKESGIGEGQHNPQFFQASDYILKDYKSSRVTHDLFKLIKINETLDSTMIKDTVGPNETVLLNKLNLDNSKWSDKYVADTTYGVYGDADLLTYTCNDKELPIQKVTVYLNQGKVTTIKVNSQRSSLINHHEQLLTYYPGAGYDLVSTQKMWSGDTIRMNVKATFIPK